MRATVGRIPIAGPIISSVATQMVNEELSKVQIIGDGSAKGQLISKCLFCFFNSSKKRTKSFMRYFKKILTVV